MFSNKALVWIGFISFLFASVYAPDLAHKIVALICLLFYIIALFVIYVLGGKY